MTRRLRTTLLTLLVVPHVAGAFAGEPAPTIGHIYESGAFHEERLPHLGDVGRLLGELDLAEGEPLRVRREDFGGDAEPEWLVLAPDRLCERGDCLQALFAGDSQREIGRFHGTLIVLKRRQNGYPVIQTLRRQDEGFSSLRTHVFVNATYQVEEDVLIGEAARLRLEAMLERRH